ncbi:hypothetical protein HZC27_05620 [Candidatus Roizmanbacteria bacterium]|nr:hypothetical protein [Candidatus Roizmanbacteria bacterium]
MQESSSSPDLPPGHGSPPTPESQPEITLRELGDALSDLHKGPNENLPPVLDNAAVELTKDGATILNEGLPAHENISKDSPDTGEVNINNGGNAPI